VRYPEDLSRDGSYAYLADGITEALISELDRVQTLDMVSRNGVAGYRGSDSVARALGEGTMVEGSVEPRGDESVRIDIRLVDGESGGAIRRQSLDQPTTALLTLREAVAGQVSILLREWLGEEVELRRWDQGTTDDRAWVLVLRAERATKNMDDAFAAREGDRMEHAYARADEPLEQAETLDPQWSEPRCSGPRSRIVDPIWPRSSRRKPRRAS
jgi:adenylate cyclase